MRFGRLSVLALSASVVLMAGCAAGESVDSGADGSTMSGTGGAGGAGGIGGAGGLGSGGAGEKVCVPGKQDECACPGGTKGVQACLADGSGYSACECAGAGGAGGAGGATGGAGGAVPCGNGVCEEDENCHSCELDCGACAPCLYKSCAQAMIPPPGPQMSHADWFDNQINFVPPSLILEQLRAQVAQGGLGLRTVAAALAPRHAGETPFATHLRGLFAKHPKAERALRRQLARAGLTDVKDYAEHYPEPAPPMRPMSLLPNGGTVECGAPMLRMRVAQILVSEEDDDMANDIVYCMVTTDSQAGAEIRVTPKTPNLDEGDKYDFSIPEGIMWGLNGPRSPQGNLLITYNCIEADDNSTYTKLLEDIGNASSQIGGALNQSGIPYGWVFEVVGAVLPVIGGALSLDGDDQLFNATQTIEADKQLELTTGAFWTVRRSGTHSMSDWDWTLRIEAWGCAEFGSIP